MQNRSGSESTPESKSPEAPKTSKGWRWATRRRWFRIRSARFHRTVSPGRIMALYLGLLSLAVLTVVLIFLETSPEPIPGAQRDSASKPPAEAQFQLLQRQTALLIKDKKLAEAEEKLAVMNTLRPDDPSILSHAAAIETQRKNYDKARELYQAVIEKKPSNYVAAYNLAEIAFVTNNFPEAKRRFQNLRRTRPHDDTLLFRIFLCEFLQDRFEAAREISLKLSRSGRTPVWYYANAALAREAKNDKEAEEFLSQARILYPSESEFYDATFRNLGLLEPASGRTNKQP